MLPTLTPQQISMMSECPQCQTPFIYDSGEYVCSSCGIVKPTLDHHIDSRVFNEMEIESKCVYGGGLGTDIYSKARGEDGSNSASYDLHGGNGKFEAVVSVMQPWDLLRVVEPNSKFRSMKEQYAAISLQRGIDQTELSNTFGAILRVAKQIQYDEEHHLIDSNSRETASVTDCLVFCTPSSAKRKLKLFLKELRDTLE